MIGNYGFLSDCQTAALVDGSGSIDWWCPPRFDSASVFGRLLGPDAGHWALRPVQEWTSHREYLPGTLVLRTTFVTASGSVAVTDALALDRDSRGHAIGRRSPHTMLRRVEGIDGDIEMTMDFSPQMEYGLTNPHLTLWEGGALAQGGPVRLTLRSEAALTAGADGIQARFMVRAGERVDFSAEYRSSTEALVPEGDHAPRAATIEDTIEGWASWSGLHRPDLGEFNDVAARSALILQGLTYAPTGAVVAAATTSLPEVIGGDLNWDYRYAWLRDFSLTLRSLWIAACPDEALLLFNWISDATGRLDSRTVQIMYGVGGERIVAELELDHLPGFAGSTPVRIGNGAWDQRQLDVLGEVLDAAHQLREQLGEMDERVQQLLIGLADRAADHWQQPDAGMWESRDAQRDYVSSKVMCWVALDRAISLVDALGAGPDVRDRWSAVREDIRSAVLRDAWSEKANAYAGAFGSDELDASILLLPIVGFLPADDPRMWATIEAIESRLGDTGLVRRWDGDGMTFLICTFWLAECLAMAGQLDRARTWFDQAAACANDLGLMSEGMDPAGSTATGNYPQAFSHVGLINAAWRLAGAKQRAGSTGEAIG
jgi:GH15 family glucan-1,4-alpha-glucosidase